MEERLSTRESAPQPESQALGCCHRSCRNDFVCFDQPDPSLITYNERYTFPMIRTVMSASMTNDQGSNPSISVLRNRYHIISDVISHVLNLSSLMLEVWIRQPLKFLSILKIPVAWSASWIREAAHIAWPVDGFSARHCGKHLLDMISFHPHNS